MLFERSRLHAGPPVSEMLTRCDRCGTWFRVRKEQLAVAEGWVRCGHCGQTFLAESSLLEEPGLKKDIQPLTPSGLASPNPVQTSHPLEVKSHPEPEPILDLHPAAWEEDRPLQTLAPESEPDAAASHLESLRDEPTSAPPDGDIPPLHTEIGSPVLPIHANPTESGFGAKRTETGAEPVISPSSPPTNSLSGRRSTAFWTIGCVLAAGLIVFEAMAISHHGQTPDIASRSPTLESPSTGKAPLSPALVHILSAEVRQTRQAPGGLAIEGTLFNASTHGLAFPELLVRFTDLEGRIVKEGLFPPTDYLPVPPHDPVIPAHGAVAFRLLVIDPGPQAVGFSLRSCLSRRGDATFCGSP